MTFPFFLFMSFLHLFADASAHSTISHPPFSYQALIIRGESLKATCPNTNSLQNFWVSDRASILCSSSQDPSQNHPENATQPTDHHPWDSSPICLNSTQHSRSYCIYTSSTHPLTTASPSSPPPPSPSPKLAQPPIHHSPSPLPNYSYYETTLPNRGKGLIANTILNLGDLILSSTPVLIFEESTFDVLRHEERLPFQRQAVEKVARRDKGIVLWACGTFWWRWFWWG